MRFFAALGFAVALAFGQQNWQTVTDLPGTDFSSLSTAQKSAALKILRENGCACGCDMKLAECRVKDPACGVSRDLAATVVKGLKAGKSAAEVSGDLAEAIKKGPAPRPVLEEPVSISIAGDPVRGAGDAKVTIVEFSDFQCPYCAVAAGKLNTFVEQNKNVRLIFKQFPLDIHSQARLAAQAALAAAEQNKFWELHDKMFGNYRRLSRENIMTWAKDVGLDMAKFTKDLEKPEYKTRINKELQEGVNAGVSGTPTIFINGRKYNGQVEVDTLKSIVAGEMK